MILTLHCFVRSPVCPQPTQESSPPVEFEVASIKPNRNCDGTGMPLQVIHDRLSIHCLPLRSLIRRAFAGVDERLPDVFGGPEWLKTERYDVVAKADFNASDEQMVGPMLRALLEQRFQLRVHEERRNSPVYVLKIAKSGAKLQPSLPGSCSQDDHPLQVKSFTPGKPPQRYCGSFHAKAREFTEVFEFYSVTMAPFATLISDYTGRAVVDETGLTGHFDARLEFDRTSSNPVFLNGGLAADAATSSDASTAPSIFTALSQQLGLKLSPATRPLKVIVVDHVERPAPN